MPAHFPLVFCGTTECKAQTTEFYSFHGEPHQRGFLKRVCEGRAYHIAYQLDKKGSKHPEAVSKSNDTVPTVNKHHEPRTELPKAPGNNIEYSC